VLQIPAYQLELNLTQGQSDTWAKKNVKNTFDSLIEKFDEALKENFRTIAKDLSKTDEKLKALTETDSSIKSDLRKDLKVLKKITTRLEETWNQALRIFDGFTKILLKGPQKKELEKIDKLNVNQLIANNGEVSAEKLNNPHAKGSWSKKSLKNMFLKLVRRFDHDIKTPLGVISHLETLNILIDELIQKIDNKKFKESQINEDLKFANQFINHTKNSFARLVEMFNSFTKILTEGSEKVTLREVNLDRLARTYEGVNSSSKKISGIDVKVIVDGDNGPINSVHVDQEKLYEILDNLVSNAKTYLEEHKTKHPEILITFKKTHRNLNVTVTNHGRLGVKPEEAFNDGVSTKSGKNRGQGLGIVKKLVEQMGGKVQIKNLKKHDSNQQSLISFNSRIKGFVQVEFNLPI
jgi:signal transduction histidine kinase